MMKHAVIIVYFCSPQRMDSQEATARGARLRCAPLAYQQFSRMVLRGRPRGHLGRRHPDRASWRRRLRRAGIQERDLPAVGWAIVAMTIAIILYDQLLFRPMVAWADKFRFEQTASQMVPKSAVLDLFRRSRLLKRLGEPIGTGLQRAARARIALPRRFHQASVKLPQRIVDVVWYGVLLAGLASVLSELVQFVRSAPSWDDFTTTAGNGALTLLRVAILIGLASAIWIPIGVGVGLRPDLTERVQPIVQFLAAFPANLLFPVAVFFIVHFDLAPGIWLSPLMILGTQWYILFNVIAGASVFPSDYREAAATFAGHSEFRRVQRSGAVP